jgi:crotonobetainyl-CoA:carnitine CoA-transferase CaiB-like acyl-CoA transferase
VRKFGEESYAQQSVRHNGVLVDVIDDKGSTVQSPYRFSASRSGIDPGARPPKRGEHNQDALSDWLGLPAEEVQALAEAGILLSE